MEKTPRRWQPRGLIVSFAASTARTATHRGIADVRHKTNTLSALQTITENGGHLVLVRRGSKAPVWSKWQTRKPTLDVVAAHDGRIGLIPHSIGSTALDVDHGDPRDLPTPWTRYRTARAGGAHLYYGDKQARGNQAWEIGDCSGEIRGAKGYLILHHNGADRVARALQSGRQMNLWPFPEDLIRLHEAELIVPTVRQLHAVEPPGTASLRLEGVYEGARNESLFLVTRTWAYRQRRGADLGAWCARVRAFALESNTRFPDPLIEREALAVSYSASTWIWSAFNEIIPTKGKGRLDHGSVAQSWRGTYSGRARRRETRARDRAIVGAVQRGESMRSVSTYYGITEGAVRWIVRRAAEEQSAHGASVRL